MTAGTSSHRYRKDRILSLYLPCTFPVPSLYLPCTFPVSSHRYRKDRDAARAAHKRAGIPFIEVFMDVPLDVVKVYRVDRRGGLGGSARWT